MLFSATFPSQPPHPTLDHFSFLLLLSRCSFHIWLQRIWMCILLNLFYLELLCFLSLKINTFHPTLTALAVTTDIFYSFLQYSLLLWCSRYVTHMSLGSCSISLWTLEANPYWSSFSYSLMHVQAHLLWNYINKFSFPLIILINMIYVWFLSTFCPCLYSLSYEKVLYYCTWFRHEFFKHIQVAHLKCSSIKPKHWASCRFFLSYLWSYLFLISEITHVSVS